MNEYSVQILKDLSEKGFNGDKAMTYGWCIRIPKTFRFNYVLWITDGDVYGTIEGKISGDEILNFKEWIDRLKFRNEDKVKYVYDLLNDLRDTGFISFDD